MRLSLTPATLLLSAALLLASVPAGDAAPDLDIDYNILLDLDFYVTDDRPPKPMIDVIFTSSKEVAGYQIGFKTEEDAPVAIAKTRGGVSSMKNFQVSFSARTGLMLGISMEGERLNPTDGEEVLISVELERKHLCGHSLCHPICVSEAIFSDPKAQSLSIRIPDCGYQNHRGNFKSVIGLIILTIVLVGLFIASRKKVYGDSIMRFIAKKIRVE